MYSIKNYKWAEAFNLDQKDLEKWQEEAGQQSFLLWALTQKRIDRKKYIEWASNFYKMPIIENLFFEEQSMNYQQWNQIKNLEKWQEEMAPIAVWEGTLFIACLEKPSINNSSSFKYYFVLATDLALRTNWKYLKNLKELPAHTLTQIKTPSLNLSLPESETERNPSEDNTEFETQRPSQAFDMKKESASKTKTSLKDDPASSNTVSGVFFKNITNIKNYLQNKEEKNKLEDDDFDQGQNTKKIKLNNIKSLKSEIESKELEKSNAAALSPLNLKQEEDSSLDLPQEVAPKVELPSAKAPDIKNNIQLEVAPKIELSEKLSQNKDVKNNIQLEAVPKIELSSVEAPDLNTKQEEDLNLDLPQEVAPKVELSSAKAPDIKNNIQLEVAPKIELSEKLSQNKDVKNNIQLEAVPKIELSSVE
ncbi:MAG: hypothetical protein ACR2M7_06000, partial [Bdellovibrionales bacterium]